MPLRVYKRKGGKTWSYEGTVNGERLRGVTGVSLALPKSLAERVAHDIETKHWKVTLDGPESVLTFAKAASLYREAGNATRFLDRIEDYWKNTLVKDIKPGMIRQMAIDLYPTQAGATRNRQAIIPCSAIINHAAESELCPRIRVRRFDHVKKVVKAADLEWVRAFAAAAEQPHLGALALFMFLTAARITEALNVSWDDVDLKARTVLLRETKVSEERLAHLPQELVVSLANIRRGDYGRTSGETVFRYFDRNSAGKEWRRVVREAKLKRLHPHCCRHGFATTLLRRGIDVKTVMWLGGWTDVKNFMETYAHAINDATLVERLIDTPWTQEILDNARNPMIAAVS